jgi:succinoglycan biosynthesis transport protein ExoP
MKARTSSSPKALVSPYARAHEPFRMLRLAIELSTTADADGGTAPATIVFTSAGAGEGKSTIAANYAAAAAHAGQTVLLVDADVRRPTAHSFFGLSVGPGLLDALVRAEGEEGFGRNVAAHERLTILTAGATSVTADIVASQRMQRLLHSARKRYDTVVIDTPPVLFAAETLALAALDDVRTVMVTTPTAQRRSLRRALHKLELAGSDTVGVVLNREGKLSAYGTY